MSQLHPDGIAALLRDPAFGAGNFLFKAAALSAHHDVPFLALERPYRTLTGVDITILSLDDLVRVVGELASFYHEAGVTSKDVIGIYLDDTADYFFHFIALSSLGAIPALMNSSLSPEIVARYLQRIEAVGVFADQGRMAKVRAFIDALDCSMQCWVQGELAPPSGDLPTLYPHRHVAGDPVLLTHTSGTTGLPKAVQAAHIPFLHGVKYRLANPLRHVTRYFMALPNAHNSAIAYLMEAVIRGCPCMVPARKDAQNFARALESYRPDFVIAFPKQLVDLCLIDLSLHDLSSVHYWRSTGDAVHESHVRVLTRFGVHEENEKIVPGSIYIDGLGSSEMGSSLFTIFHTQHSRDYNRCVGKPQPWVDAQVIDEQGRLLGVHQIGRLGIKSPSLTAGYWNNSNLSEKFRVSGYWITGDLVYRDELGRFFHLDRITDRIATPDGVVYSLLTEEYVMKKFDEIFECSVYARAADDGSQCAEISVDLAPSSAGQVAAECLLSSINAWLAEQGMTQLSSLVFVTSRAGAVPEGVTGKVLKRVLRESHANKSAKGLLVAR